MPKTTFESVPVRVVRDEEQGMYVIGVDVEGAFLTISAIKLGHGDELRQRAADEAHEQQQQQQAEQEQRDAEERERVRREAEQQQQQ